MYILNKSVLKKVLIYSLIILPVLVIGFILGASFIEYDISSKRVEAQEISLDTGFDFREYHLLYVRLADITYAIDNRDLMLNMSYAGENDLRNSFFIGSIATTIFAYANIDDLVLGDFSARANAVKISKIFRSREPIYADFTIFKPRITALKQKVNISPKRAGELGWLFMASKNSDDKDRPKLTTSDIKDITIILNHASELRSLYASIVSLYRVNLYSSSITDDLLLKSTAIQFDYSKNSIINRFERGFDMWLYCRDFHKLQPGKPCI